MSLPPDAIYLLGKVEPVCLACGRDYSKCTDEESCARLVEQQKKDWNVRRFRHQIKRNLNCAPPDDFSERNPRRTYEKRRRRRIKVEHAIMHRAVRAVTKALRYKP